MSLEIIPASLDDKDRILLFENEKLLKEIEGEIEQSMARWNSRWRPESLEYYLKVGWSFIAVTQSKTNENELLNPNQKIVGYFLAQPLLFLDGQTQSLWIEHVSSENYEVYEFLSDFAIRFTREKHFQKVYFPSKLSKFPPWEPAVTQVFTTKAEK